MFETISFWHWFAVALVLLILETFGAAGFLLANAIAATATGIIALFFPELDTQWQFTLYACFTLFVTGFWWYRSKYHPTKTDAPLLNHPAQQLIGQKVRLNNPIVGGKGKVKINDSNWFVECTVDSLDVDSQVTVVAVIDEMTLQIAPEFSN